MDSHAFLGFLYTAGFGESRFLSSFLALIARLPHVESVDSHTPSGSSSRLPRHSPVLESVAAIRSIRLIVNYAVVIISYLGDSVV